MSDHPSDWDGGDAPKAKKRPELSELVFPFPTKFSLDTKQLPNVDLSLSSASGLTKREFFAAMAMQAIIGSKVLSEFDVGTSHREEHVALSAVHYADALIEELERE